MTKIMERRCILMQSNCVILVMFSILVCGCYAHQVVSTPSPVFSVDHKGHAIYKGKLANRASELDYLLKNCSCLRDSLGRSYNALSNSSTNWDLWTAIIGLSAQATSSILSSVDNTDDAQRILSLVAGTAVAVSVAIKATSEIGARLSERHAEFEQVSSLIEYTKDEFVRIQPYLTDPDSTKIIDDLLVKLRRDCAPCQ